MAGAHPGMECLVLTVEKAQASASQTYGQVNHPIQWKVLRVCSSKKLQCFADALVHKAPCE